MLKSKEGEMIEYYIDAVLDCYDNGRWFVRAKRTKHGRWTKIKTFKHDKKEQAEALVVRIREGDTMLEYPTDDDITAIKLWSIKSWEDCESLLGFVKTVWHWKDIYFEKDEKGRYSLSTGGWSGNEEIISELIENRMFWISAWESSRRGGHYTFCDVDKSE